MNAANDRTLKSVNKACDLVARELSNKFEHFSGAQRMLIGANQTIWTLILQDSRMDDLELSFLVKSSSENFICKMKSRRDCRRCFKTPKLLPQTELPPGETTTQRAV